MNIFLIFLSGLIATSLMTLFSYIWSWINTSKFKEPQLLNLLLQSSTTIRLNPGKKNVRGWIIHYTIGWFFVLCFDIIWRNTPLEPSFGSGAILGAIAGLMGITGWKIFFKLNADPPEIKFGEFYFQLIIAHVIFGLGAVVVYI